MTDATQRRQEGGTHYLDMEIQPWDAMQTWMTKEQYIGYHKGTVIGYIARCDQKGGLLDIKKAAHHLEELIAFIESHPPPTPADLV
jgi:hypothetical protein